MSSCGVNLVGALTFDQNSFIKEKINRGGMDLHRRREVGNGKTTT